MFNFPAGLGFFANEPGGGSGPSPIADSFSLGFRGSNGYLNLGQPSDMNFDPNSDSFTISTWFKPASTANQRCILAKANMNSVDVTVFLGINNNGTIYALCGGGENTSGGDVTDLDWHLITLSVSGGQAKLFLDDAQVGSTFSVGSDQNLTADWLIGGSRFTDNTDISYQWYGLVDEPTFWDTNFSLQNVVDLYNSGTPIDPTTHSQSAHLLHWYRMGDDLSGDLIPVIADQVGSSDGTMTNTDGIYLFNQSPVYAPSSLDSLTTSLNCDLQFNADNYSGSGNWSSTFGTWTGVLSGTPVRQATSQFSGHYEITTANSTWFRVANSANHVITASTVMTYVLRMYTGAENGSGGFYCGYNGEGAASDWQIYNYFYDKDAASRIRVSNDASDYLAAESHAVQNQNKYIIVHVVINMPSTTLKVYVNGGLVVSDSSTSGAFSPPATAPLGILGWAKVSSGGDNSTASGQAIMEIARYRQVLTDDQIARQASVFNALKGYV